MALSTNAEVYLQTQKDIETYGWAVLSSVREHDIDYSHTLGLEQSFGHLDIEVLGLPPELSTKLLNELAAHIKAGTTYNSGAVLSNLIEGYDLMLVNNPIDPNAGAIIHNMLRLVWPDSEGRYPWEEECTAECKSQQYFVEGPTT